MNRVGRSPRSERLGVRDTWRQVARVYREQAAFLLPLALLLFVPLGLLDAVTEHAGDLEAEELTVAELVALLDALALQAVSSTLGEVFYSGAAMAAVSESMGGHPRPAVGRVMRTLPYLGLIAVDVMFVLGLGIGLALLVVPGLIFFARYVLVAPVLELDRRGVRDAFRRSRELSRGHALGLLVVLGGLWLLTDALTSAFQEGGWLALGDSLAADWAIAVAAGVVVTPIWAVTACVVTWRLVQIERGSSGRAAAAG